MTHPTFFCYTKYVERLSGCSFLRSFSTRFFVDLALSRRVIFPPPVTSCRTSLRKYRYFAGSPSPLAQELHQIVAFLASHADILYNFLCIYSYYLCIKFFFVISVQIQICFCEYKRFCVPIASMIIPITSQQKKIQTPGSISGNLDQINSNMFI